MVDVNMNNLPPSFQEIKENDAPRAGYIPTQGGNHKGVQVVITPFTNSAGEQVVFHNPISAGFAYGWVEGTMQDVIDCLNDLENAA